MLQIFLVVLFFFTANSSLETEDIKDLREYRESEKKTRADNILQEILGICVNGNPQRDSKQRKEDMQAIRRNMAVHKDTVKIKNQLKSDIKWILEESGDEKEISRIIELLKHEVKGICGRIDKPNDCTELRRAKVTSGVYQIFVQKTERMKAFCEMNTESGGWTIIQKRYDGSVNFVRSWKEYEDGFGNVNGEYWLGNRDIHLLTSSGKYELRVQLTDKNNQMKYAEYKTFAVGDAASLFKLTVGGYSGNAGDSLTYHNGMKFSTSERDNDKHPNSAINCAKLFGPWWHNGCDKSSLNRKLYNKLLWQTLSGMYAKNSVMMIRKIENI